MVMEIGRLCIKKKGREKGRKCTVVDLIDDTYVLIDGPEVKRRRCNISHLEPLDQKLEIQKDASTADVNQALTGSTSEEPEKPSESEEGEPVEAKTEEEQESEEKEEIEEEKETEEKEEPERETGS